MTGKKIGYWTVLDSYITTPKGEKKWLCRCDCGTERYVLERSLRYGGSLSCGCLARENTKKAVSHNLEGKTFGDLKVLHKAKKQNKHGGIWWTCQCSCGKIVDYPATLLVNGHRTSCGCKTKKKYYSKDISNQRFHRLTALYPIQKRSAKGSVMWHCRCDCGNEVDVSYNELVYSKRKSCGCLKESHEAQVYQLLTHIAGTSIDRLRSDRVPSNNTTGTKGVYFIKGKYVAKIVFQQKQYYLGKYDKIDDAIVARKAAEKLLAKGTVEHYEKWKIKASEDPEWAKENPFRIEVKRESDSEISALFLPIIE